MLLVDLLVGVPLPGEERVLLADDLAVEERRQRRELLGQTLDLQVAAEVSALEVNVLETYSILS